MTLFLSMEKVTSSGFCENLNPEINDLKKDSFLIYSQNTLLPLKNFGFEIRALRDVERFVNNATILFDVHANNVEELLRNVIKKTLKSSQNWEHTLQAKKNALVSNEVPMFKNCVQLVEKNYEGLLNYDHSWICATVELPFLEQSQICIVRMRDYINIGENAQSVKIFIIILAPTKEKFTKNSFEIARTFCTLFYEKKFRDLFFQSSDVSEFLIEMDRTAKLLAKGDVVAQVMLKDIQSKSDPYFKFSIFKGLRENIQRRIKFYGSDFVDVLQDAKSIRKVISTTFFLYFACILPTLAFGALNDKATEGLIDARKALLGQVIGGFIFAFFSGQPLVIIATTAPLCLYTKIIYEMSDQFDEDFFSMFATVGLFNGVFLMLFAIFDLSQLMHFCTRGIEEIFATFIFFAFVSDALKDMNHDFATNYFSTNCFTSMQNMTTSLPSSVTCNRDSSLLFVLLMLGTFWLGNQLLNFNRTSYLNNVQREFFSDYSLPIAVISFSFIAYFVFPEVQVEKFLFSQKSELQYIKFIGMKMKSIWVCLGLGFSLSLLFFMDQNVSAALVQSPKNNLKKGNSYDWDIFLVGVINIVLSLFGLPFMHGILPHSPLHARNLAEIEFRVERGQIIEHVLFVRETRLTAIFAHVFIALSLFMIPSPLDLIPIPVLDGLFLYCAFSTLQGNSFFDRFMLWFMESRLYSPTHFLSHCKITRIHLFTLIQILQLLIVCIFGFTSWPFLQMVFPVIIFLLIPVRVWLLPVIFEKDELEALDPYY